MCVCVVDVYVKLLTDTAMQLPADPFQTLIVVPLGQTECGPLQRRVSFIKPECTYRAEAAV